MKTSRLNLLLLTTALACGLLQPAAHAANLFWNSPNVGAWGDPLNWIGGIPPGPTDVVFIGPAADVDVGLPPAPVTPFTVDTINFGAGASDIIPFMDSSNSGTPPGSWNQVTVTTAITNLGLGQVIFRFTKVMTPQLDVYAGDLEIADYNWFQAATDVNIYGGTMCAGTSVPGATISAVNWNVYSGGTLNSWSPGSTIIGTVNVLGGSYFNPGCSIGTANIAGDLNYSPGGRSRFELGPPGTVGGGVNDLIIVNGNLTFNGALLEILPLTGFAPGVYRLFGCTGTITGTPTIGSAPPGFNYQISTATPGQVNLAVSSAQLVNCACLEMLPELHTNACQAVIPDLCQLYLPCLLMPGVPLNCSQTPAAGGVVGPGTHPITVTFSIPGSGQVQVCPVNFYVMAPGTNCCVPTNMLPRMVAWWPLDEVGGTVYQDLAGNNNALAQPGPINVNTPAGVPGKVAGAGWFFLSGDHGRVSPATALNFGTGSFSVDCWFKANLGPGDTRHMAIVDKLGAGRGYRVSINQGKLELRLEGTLGAQTYTSTLTVPGNAWVFIGVAVDRGPLNEVRFQVNGTPDLPQTLAAHGNIDNTTTDLLIGEPISGHTDHLLDEVEMFDSALLKAHFDLIFNAGSAGKCKPAQPCPCPPNPPNLIVNGSFENGPFNDPDGDGCEQLLNNNTSMPGWTVINDELARCQNGNIYGITASQGIKCLDLSGYTDAVPHSGVMQTVPTTTGQCYRLLFDLGGRQASGPFSVNVTAGAYSQTFTHNPTGAGTVWGSYTMLFTAVSASTVIQFEGVSGTTVIGLDNVSLVCSCDCPNCIVCPTLYQTVTGCPPLVPDYTILNYCPPPGLPQIVTQAPAPGTVLPPGQTTVIISITDSAGNNGRDCDVILTAIYLPGCPTNCVPPPSDMVLWLPFDEPTGLTAGNHYPGGNHGLLVNGPTHNLGSYVANSLCFDGLNDRVQVTSYPDIEFGTGDFSVDAWVKPGAPSGPIWAIVGHRELILSPLTVRGYVLLLWFNNSIAFQMGDGSGWQNFNSSLVVPFDNQWHHIAVTVKRGAGGVITAYLDGVPQIIGTPYPGSVTPPPTIPLYVGGDAAAPAASFNGCIDEVELFKRALTPAEITGLYNARTGGKCKTNCVIAPDNMVLWLPLDSTAGLTTPNFAIGNDGALVNGPSLNVGSYVGNSFCFSGGNGSHVQVPSYPALGFGTGDFSVDAWVNVNQASGPIRVIAGHRELIPSPLTVRGYLLLLWFNNSIAFQMGDGSGWQNFNSSLIVPFDNQWHHVAVTVQRSGSIIAYLDGVPQTIGAPYPGSVTPPPAIPFYVGGDPVSPGASFDGCIDEVEAFNRALTPAEIAFLYNSRSAGKCKECDGYPPLALNCPNQTLSVCAAPVAVKYNVTTSGGAPPVSVTCTPPSGTAFPFGTTTVTCTATNRCGETASCMFTVKVQQTPPQYCHHLVITHAGANAVISWDGPATDFRLEATDSLSPPIVWQPVTAPVQDVGGRRVVTLPISGPHRFFRLHCPGCTADAIIPAGIDLLQTLAPSFADLRDTPIPAGFFDPSSEPFAGRIDWQGGALASSQNLGQADTIVQRLAPLTLQPGTTEAVPIQLVALSLVSTGSVTVTYSGGTSEQWNVAGSLSSLAPQPRGAMTVTRNAAGNGGTFDSMLPVLARFVFTRTSDGARRILDLGEMPGMFPAVNLHVTGASWSAALPGGFRVPTASDGLMVDHDGNPATPLVGPLPATSWNFFPGVDPFNPGPPDPNFYKITHCTPFDSLISYCHVVWLPPGDTQ